MELNELQRQTHAWRTDQFGEIDIEDQLLGTFFEMSELGERIVKGNNYDPDWADEEQMKTEAGDVLIYFLGVLSIAGYDAEECVDLALKKNNLRNWDEHMKAP